MKKVIKQDGTRKVFIMEDGSELPFNDYKKEPIKEVEKPKKKKKFFKKEDDIENDY